jgi:predicted ATPase
MGTKGYAHPDVADAFGRASSLISQTDSVGTIPHFSVLYGVFSANFVGGKARAALDRAKEFLSLAQSGTVSGALLLGHRIVSTALFTIGDYPAVFSHAQRAVALYVPEQHHALAFQFGQDIGVSALCYYTLALWHLGYPDQASNAARETLRNARQSAHAHTIAYAVFHLGIKAALERNVDEIAECSNELIALAREHGLGQWSGWGLIMQGWALAQRGQGPISVDRVRQGLTVSRETGARTFEPIFLGLLAESLALIGATEEGLAIIAEALAMAKASGQNGNNAELYRLQGELLAHLPFSNLAEIEASFRLALAVAREQGTRGCEMRAAISLTRLLTDQDRHDEARNLLAPVYDCFTEGFDTPDLKKAKALLDELNA